MSVLNESSNGLWAAIGVATILMMIVIISSLFIVDFAAGSPLYVLKMTFISVGKFFLFFIALGIVITILIAYPARKR